jgi:hypothetical protein
MGSLDRAKAHLKRATEIDARFRLMALEDPDLEPLWASMSGRAKLTRMKATRIAAVLMAPLATIDAPAARTWLLRQVATLRRFSSVKKRDQSTTR